MFKQYLRVQPLGVQITIFFTIWIAFTLIYITLQPIILNSVGLKSMDIHSLNKNPNLFLALNGLGTIFLFLLPACLFAYLSDPKPRQYLGLIKPKHKSHWVWIVILVLGMIPTITSIGSWIKELDLGATARALNEEREGIFKAYLSTSSNIGMLKNLFFIALLPAVAEELFFRGIVQKFAYSWTKKPYLAILISGLTFAVVHFSIYEFIPILIAGLILAWVYYITSSIWLSILLHFLNNGIQVVLVFLATKNPSLDQIDQNTLFIIAFAIGGFLITAFSLMKLNKIKTPLPFHWDVRQTMSISKEL